MQINTVTNINNTLSFSRQPNRDVEIRRIQQTLDNNPRRNIFGIIVQPKYELIEEHNAMLAKKLLVNKKCRSIGAINKNIWAIIKNTDEYGQNNKMQLLNHVLKDERMYRDKRFADFAVQLLIDTNNDAQLDASLKMLDSKIYTSHTRKTKKLAHGILSSGNSKKQIVSIFGDVVAYKDHGEEILKKAFSDKKIYENLDLMKEVFVDYSRRIGIYSTCSELLLCSKMDTVLKAQK